MGMVIATSLFVLVTTLGSWDIIKPNFSSLKSCPFDKCKESNGAHNG
tara:strand:- start:76202 stop:76342 length:141 start_codon:yes stop_codon:yes gene_type:complete